MSSHFHGTPQPSAPQNSQHRDTCNTLYAILTHVVLMTCFGSVIENARGMGTLQIIRDDEHGEICLAISQTEGRLISHYSRDHRYHRPYNLEMTQYVSVLPVMKEAKNHTRTKQRIKRVVHLLQELTATTYTAEDLNHEDGGRNFLRNFGNTSHCHRSQNPKSKNKRSNCLQ